jgi:hypothetical protein
MRRLLFKFDGGKEDKKRKINPATAKASSPFAHPDSVI